VNKKILFDILGILLYAYINKRIAACGGYFFLKFYGN